MIKTKNQNLLKVLCFMLVIAVSFSLCTNVNAAINCDKEFNTENKILKAIKKSSRLFELNAAISCLPEL